MSDKVIDLLLSMVFPFCIVYLSVLIGYTFIKEGLLYILIADMFIVCVCALGFIYGVMCIIRELEEHGSLTTFRYWLNRYKDFKENGSSSNNK